MLEEVVFDAYSTISVDELRDGTIEVISEQPTKNVRTRYLYDAEMAIVGMEADNYGSTSFTVYYYMTATDRGTWSVREAYSETDELGYPEEWTPAPVDFAAELSK